MDPSQLEFIGENEMIGIIPNFSLADPVHFISGSVGPFRAGLPVHGNLMHCGIVCSKQIYTSSIFITQCRFGWPFICESNKNAA